MRSRYAGFAVGGSLGLDHVFRTWHPRIRPDDIEPDPTLTWTGLEILEAQGDVVEFVATYERGGVVGSRRERSRFEQRGGRWLYVDGELS